MTPTTEDKRHLLDLQYLQATLEDADFTTQLSEKSTEYALSFLSVGLSAEELSTPAYAQLMYIPTAEMLEETNLLQIFGYLTETAMPDEEPVRKFLDFLNTRSPMGYFSLDGEGKLFYRYVLANPRFTVANPAMFRELFELYANTFQVFGGTLVELAQGKISLEAAKARIGE